MGTMTKVEEIRQAAWARVRENALEDAIALFDQALAIADDDEAIELLTINKAGILIQMELDGPDVQHLPQILMRRRTPKHTFLAAYHLQQRYNLAKDFKKAYNYGRVALEAADRIEEKAWKPRVLNEMGRTCVYDSRIPEAIEAYREALAMLESFPEDVFARSFATQNLGYCLVVEGELEEGIETIRQAIDLMRAAGAEGYVAESYIDLCYGYLELGDLESARKYGEDGLEQATETRQLRNAHYLLGEVAYKQGDTVSAESHFQNLAKFYPDFPQLKNVLLALDLRKMVNLKL
ncbi:MAG: tetratricopeptide repeat protein [Acidobacteria bacterium]|nr:tetratricopeptide repeat protein [Acidobacteriota bacterium]